MTRNSVESEEKLQQLQEYNELKKLNDKIFKDIIKESEMVDVIKLQNEDIEEIKKNFKSIKNLDIEFKRISRKNKEMEEEIIDTIKYNGKNLNDAIIKYSKQYLEIHKNISELYSENTTKNFNNHKKLEKSINDIDENLRKHEIRLKEEISNNTTKINKLVFEELGNVTDNINNEITNQMGFLYNSIDEKYKTLNESLSNQLNEKEKSIRKIMKINTILSVATIVIVILIVVFKYI